MFRGTKSKWRRKKIVVKVLLEAKAINTIQKEVFGRCLPTEDQKRGVSRFAGA